MATREQIMTALLDRLAAGYSFVTVGRRNRDPESVGREEIPALFLVEHDEEYAPGQGAKPPIRILLPLAVVYCSDGGDENVIIASTINNILDAFDAAIAPDSPGHGRCTLGGLVHSVEIEGRIEKVTGDMKGRGIAVVPFRVLIP